MTQVEILSASMSSSFRTKKHIQLPEKTDKEIFAEMPCGDVWHDANLISVFMYLYNLKTTCVPSTWHACMAAFKDELQGKVGVNELLMEEYNTSRKRRYVSWLLSRMNRTWHAYFAQT